VRTVLSRDCGGEGKRHPGTVERDRFSVEEPYPLEFEDPTGHIDLEHRCLLRRGGAQLLIQHPGRRGESTGCSELGEAHEGIRRLRKCRIDSERHTADRPDYEACFVESAERTSDRDSSEPIPV